jgi:hypothetical protein
MKEHHPVQLDILSKLLFSEQLKYSELKHASMESSGFIFHLDKLIQNGLIEKLADGYKLSAKGKEYANRMKAFDHTMPSFPKTTTVLCCERDEEIGKSYLIYKRLKNPFYGHQGFPTHKVWFGSKIYNSAVEGLMEETNLQGTPELFAIRHYHVHLENGDLVEDKIMYMFRFRNPVGDLKGNDEGEFQWVHENNIAKVVSDPFPEFYESLELLKAMDGTVTFKEVDQTGKGF